MLKIKFAFSYFIPLSTASVCFLQSWICSKIVSKLLCHLLANRMRELKAFGLRNEWNSIDHRSFPKGRLFVFSIRSHLAPCDSISFWLHSLPSHPYMPFATSDHKVRLTSCLRVNCALRYSNIRALSLKVALYWMYKADHCSPARCLSTINFGSHMLQAWYFCSCLLNANQTATSKEIMKEFTFEPPVKCHLPLISCGQTWDLQADCATHNSTWRIQWFDDTSARWRSRHRELTMSCYTLRWKHSIKTGWF